MRTEIIVLFLFSLPVSAVELGIFSLATEADWGAAFELKAGGRLEVTPWVRSEEGADEQAKPIAGHWKESAGGLELEFGKFKDRFRFESECTDWKDYHCFRYAKSLNTLIGRGKIRPHIPFRALAASNVQKCNLRVN